jgi:hypothetical protein
MANTLIGKILASASYRLNRLDKKIQGAIGKFTPQQKISLADCIEQNWENVSPVFVLSTGRSGTLLLNELLSISAYAYPLHQPRPELIRVSKLAYEEIYQKPEIFEEVFRTCREELVFDAVKFNKIYIETNNRISFFAPVILNVFPNAKFIHLVRHPGDFVRSGIRRKWYSGSHEHDLGRILPVKGEYKERWSRMSNIEKIGWLWNETNKFIENFTKRVPQNKFLFMKAEQLFKDINITKKIYEFIELPDFNEKKVAKIIKSPVNVQRKGQYPLYKDWKGEDKSQLQMITTLAQKYGYYL